MDNALKNASIFGSTYVYKALFKKMVKIKNQYKNQLTEDHLKQLLHAASIMITSHFDTLVKSQNQCQVSH